ncbi:relaxase [Sphingobium amiense]|uniref:Relaxase n=1 Tax=Sphingobium amiense TaxID=135719 RepID=A0A494W6P9_9SPHN|nr:relaxase [Sphingobium amiense]BBD98868.1 relaxase [Sphingobium amiense]
MIIQASKRGGAMQLGRHLLNGEQNELIEVHEVSGFISDNLMGAMKESYALSLGTKCRQHLFSVSLNPPAGEAVHVETFEQACNLIEQRLGLSGQPRMIVFHEKEGRRHAHAVWSRIDSEKMTAIPMPYFKMRLRDVSKQLYLELGWQMPDGFRDARLRDPRNFTLDQWQESKRKDLDPREVKAAIMECWKSDVNGPAFARALEERGMFLAQGGRKNHVAVTIDGRVFAIARVTGEKSKDVRARLGDPKQLRGVADAVREIGETVAPRLSRYISEAKRIAHNAMKPLNERKQDMKQQHSQERKILADKQRERNIAEQLARSARVRKGVAGVWDIMTGRYFKTRKRNEMEAFFGVQRDRAQRHDLVTAQMKDRQNLQQQISQVRGLHAAQILDLYRDAAQYRGMVRGDYQPDGADRGRARSQQPRGPELG